jgi:drug/metabolite transporter (DMT)-like permease
MDAVTAGRAGVIIGRMGILGRMSLGRQHVPRRERLAWAAFAAVAGVALLVLRERRFDDPTSVWEMILSGVLCGFVGYFGSTLEQRSKDR